MAFLPASVPSAYNFPFTTSPPNKEGSFVVSRNGLVIFNVVRFALSQKKRIREGLRHGIAPIPLTFQYRLFSRRIEGLAWQPAQELWVTSSWPNQPDCLLQGRYPRVFTDRRSGSWELGLWNHFLELLSLVNSCNWALLKYIVIDNFMSWSIFVWDTYISI